MMINQFKLKILKFLENNFWIGATVAVKALAQIAILKSVSIFFGASGVGYLGQVLGCITIVNSLFSVGLVNFLITELSKNKHKLGAIEETYRLVGFWCALFSLSLVFVAALFGNYFSQITFNDSKEVLFFLLLSVGFIFLNFTSITQGIFSSTKSVKTLFFYNLASVILGLSSFMSIARMNQDYIPYAALAFYFSQGLVGFFFLIKKDKNLFWLFRPRFNQALIIKLIKFTLVMAITGALGALQQVYIRSYIINILNLSWMDVGHWQALLKISEINLSFIGLTMISLYLPTISEILDSSTLRKTAFRYLKQVFIIVILICLAIVFMGEFVLKIIYSKDFIFLNSLLKIQMLGDVFKLCSWIFTYFILSKLKLHLFLFMEILGLSILTILGIYLSKQMMINGLIYAQALTSFLMFIITFFVYNYYSKRDYLWNK